MSDQQELDLAKQIINDHKPIVIGVANRLLEAGEFGDLGVLIKVARDENLMAQLAGRIVVLFPEYDDDPREVFEIPECRDWLLALEQKVPYLSVLVHPTSTFKLLMLCHIEWTKDPEEDHIVPDAEQAVGFMLDAGMTAFVFAHRQKLDARGFAGDFLRGIGLEDVVDDGLLDEYARVYQSSSN